MKETHDPTPFIFAVFVFTNSQSVRDRDMYRESALTCQDFDPEIKYVDDDEIESLLPWLEMVVLYFLGDA